MLSTYGGNLYANVVTGRQSAPTSWYLALLTELPGVDDSGTDIASAEPSGASYTRKLISTGLSNWSAPADGYCTYTPVITYSPAENWGTLTAYALCTASTGGQVVFFDLLAYPVVIRPNSVVTVPSTSLGIGMVVI
jgi:hypothetical protein